MILNFLNGSGISTVYKGWQIGVRWMLPKHRDDGERQRIIVPILEIRDDGLYRSHVYKLYDDRNHIEVEKNLYNRSVLKIISIDEI